ncbi:phasin family protein [Ahrensia marina]|uniref:phasin family protein n=1 Tax=Ahrensia marina TaxID=1514904 RepID=UPI0035CF87DC
MMTNFDEVQKASKENMDLAMASMAAMSKGVQAMALETQDYSKKAMETGSAAMEDLLAAKSLDKAVEVQSDYMKTAYEAFVGQATKVNEMFVDLAKETYKPYEGVFAKVGK